MLSPIPLSHSSQAENVPEASPMATPTPPRVTPARTRGIFREKAPIISRINPANILSPVTHPATLPPISSIFFSKASISANASSGSRLPIEPSLPPIFILQPASPAPAPEPVAISVGWIIFISSKPIVCFLNSFTASVALLTAPAQEETEFVALFMVSEDLSFLMPNRTLNKIVILAIATVIHTTTFWIMGRKVSPNRFLKPCHACPKVAIASWNLALSATRLSLI